MNLLANKLEMIGRAISHCSEQLAELVELGGEEVYFLGDMPNAWSSLANHEMVLGNQIEGYSASTLLMELANRLARQEASRRLAPDVDDWLAQVELRVEQLINSQNDSNTTQYGRHLGEIRQLVLVMREGLNNELRNLEFVINTKFGHVESVRDKQAENQYLINRVTRLSNKLSVLDLGCLLRIAGNNTDLLALLTQRLHETIDSCRRGLIAAIPQLKRMLWEFTKRNEEAQRVWALHRHLTSRASPFGQEVSDDDLIINGLTAIPQQQDKATLTVDLMKEDDYEKLVEIVRGMRKPLEQQLSEDPEKKAPSALNIDDENEAEIANESIFDTHLENMVNLTVNGPVSCMDYWSTHIADDACPGGYLQWAFHCLDGLELLEMTPMMVAMSPMSAHEQMIDFEVKRT